MDKLKKIAVASLGCKTNQYEMDALAQSFRERGFMAVDAREEADVYVLNTCTVTAEAERKARQMLRRFRRQNKEALIVASGCYSQRSNLRELADLVIGTGQRDVLPELILNALGGGGPDTFIPEASGWTRYEELDAPAIPDETRAFLKIQDGCDNRCAYCAICLARGPSRSRELAEIAREARHLLDLGYRELVLTGTNLNQFDNPDLISVLEALDPLEGLARLRLGSLESATITEDFVSRAAALEHFCPSFHLSLQSGSDRILRAMRRRDNREKFEAAVCRIRMAFPKAGITTDIIVGFPGETEEDFQDTMEFCSRISFLRIHVFRFSRRPGTAADRMPGQLDDQVSLERSERLRELAKKEAEKAIRERMGQVRELLVEQCDGEGRAWGYTEDYLHAGVQIPQDGPPPRQGDIRKIRITGLEGESAGAEFL